MLVSTGSRDLGLQSLHRNTRHSHRTQRPVKVPTLVNQINIFPRVVSESISQPSPWVVSSSGSWSPVTGRGRVVLRRAALRGPALRPGGRGRCHGTVRGRGRRRAVQRTLCS